MTSCHCSAVILWNVPSRVMPALLTRTSTGPSAASTACTIDAAESGLPTSPGTTVMSRPLAFIAACQARARPSSR